ncbi:prephenate dehydratase [Microcoleus sp. FACHB-672]|uniref:prephenate dehydratase n=1 Tax=Microcoleus sp. FACHB-672 TaxID=2692825 RepID=UPI00168446A2|nr:prephenate dehydratase [Microcoleus sp. FACHB-672]MBD2041336.1 prephenate dehydratase [Microcoleus sp. FACHB-672]
MTVSVAHLGPPGTYAEAAALAYVYQVKQETGCECLLYPYPSIAQTLRAVAQGEAHLAVVPVENSIEGSVVVTLDTLWQLDSLRIQRAIVLPISHALLSTAQALEEIQTVYSHPQALAQCQGWLEKFLPNVQPVPTNSTTEALQFLEQEPSAAAIASLRAAELYKLPVLAHPLNDYPDNCTRFWVLARGEGSEISGNFPSQMSAGTSHTSLAFSLPANVPGALLKPLQVFDLLSINMSRIESRPTKRSLGEYLFFIDLEGDINQAPVKSALQLLTLHTETLKVLGSYSVLSLQPPSVILANKV